MCQPWHMANLGRHAIRGAGTRLSHLRRIMIAPEGCRQQVKHGSNKCRERFFPNCLSENALSHRITMFGSRIADLTGMTVLMGTDR